jgi:hypothetical protein
MLTYKYYRFPDSSLCPPIDEWPSGVSVDVIGQIIDEEGSESTPPTYKEGWHVNVVYQGEPDLSFVQAFEIQVNTPVRKWLGQPA